MEIKDMIGFAFEASITLVILFTCYWLLLKRTTFHDLNRGILLLIIVFTAGIPVLSRLMIDARITSIPLFAQANHFFSAPLNNKINGFALNGAFEPNLGKSQLFILLLAGTIYGLGLLFCLGRIIYQVALLYRMAQSFPKKNDGNHTLVFIKKDTSPFCFFNWIFLNQEIYNEGQFVHIIRHEQVHVRGYHTLDILLAELFASVFWFNPYAWLLRSQVRLNLEYIADRKLLRDGAQRKKYQYDLLNFGFASPLTRAGSHFNAEHLKKRIGMMNRKPSSAASYWKYLLLAPAVFLLVTAFRHELRAPIHPSNMNIYLAIKDDMTEGQLQKIEHYLGDEGLDFSYSALHYNLQGSLSGIHVVIKQDNRVLGELTVPNHPHALAMPVYFYLLRDKAGQTGLSWGTPKGLSNRDEEVLASLNGLLKYQFSTKLYEIHGTAYVANKY